MKKLRMFSFRVHPVLLPLHLKLRKFMRVKVASIHTTGMNIKMRFYMDVLHVITIVRNLCF